MNKIPIFLIIILAVVLMAPTLSLHWDLVDDGLDMAGAQVIENGLINNDWASVSHGLFEGHFGRVRPAYQLSFWIRYHFWGLNIALYHLSHLGLFIISSLLLFGTIYQLTQRSKAALVATIVWMTQPLEIINWYFLGKAEPFQNLYFLASIFCLTTAFRHYKKSKKIHLSYWFSLIFIPLMFGSKETAVAYLIPLGFITLLLFFRKGHIFPLKYLLIYQLVGLLSFLAVFILLKLTNTTPQGYVNFYSLYNLKDILWKSQIYYRLVIYNFSFLYFLPIVYFLYQRVKTGFATLLSIGQLFFLLGHLSFILILIPFSIRTEDYYLTPSLLFYCLFLGLTLTEAMNKQLFRQKRVLATIFVLVLFLTVRNGLYLHSYSTEFVTVQTVNSQMMEWVVDHTPQYHHVLFDFPESNRGYIGGIRIQRTSIFPCSQRLDKDPVDLFSYTKNNCADQSVYHIYNENDQLTYLPDEHTISHVFGPTQEKTQVPYDLLVVNKPSVRLLNDDSGFKPLYSIERLKKDGLDLTEITAFQDRKVILSREKMLEDYIWLYITLMKGEIQHIIKFHELATLPQVIQYWVVEPTWIMYKIKL